MEKRNKRIYLLFLIEQRDIIIINDLFYSSGISNIPSHGYLVASAYESLPTKMFSDT